MHCVSEQNYTGYMKKMKRYKFCTLYQLQCVIQYLYASGDSSICRPHTKLEVWLFLKKKHLFDHLSEVNCLSVFPRVKYGIKKTMTDILAGDRIHVRALVYASKAADPYSRLKLGL